MGIPSKTERLLTRDTFLSIGIYIILVRWLLQLWSHQESFWLCYRIRNTRLITELFTNVGRTLYLRCDVTTSHIQVGIAITLRPNKKGLRVSAKLRSAITLILCMKYNVSKRLPVAFSSSGSKNKQLWRLVHRMKWRRNGTGYPSADPEQEFANSP